MSDTVIFILWLAGIPIAIAIVMLLGMSVEWAAWQLSSAAARCQSRVEAWRTGVSEATSRIDDHEAFRRWLAAKVGTARTSGAVDEQLVEAQRQAESIRVLIEEEVPKAVLRCVETHRLMARVTGVSHMFEIAYEPECQQLRAGIVWLLVHTVELLEHYPLRHEDSRLLHNSIVLRKRALPNCRRCPYIQVPVDQLPPLCPTAQIVQLRGEPGDRHK